MASRRAAVRPRTTWMVVGWVVAGLVAFLGSTTGDSAAQLGLDADHVASAPAAQP